MKTDTKNEKKSKYIEDLRQDFVQRAMAHGANEQGASELAEFLVDKVDFSFRNGLRFAKERGWTTSREPAVA